MRISLALLLMCAFSATVHAECVRWKPTPRPPNAPPEFDGPGSFGKLQDTVTLDCLKYVGSIQKNGAEHVLIKDETGIVHTLQLGSYMGENSGVIVRIDRDAIYLKQLVKRNGELGELIIKFPKE
jgi:hypothetical protein